jgi:hypothetical protein
MTVPVRTAIECLSVADALRTVAVQVGRLERAGHPAASGTEAAVVRTNTPLLADALTALAARLASEAVPAA